MRLENEPGAPEALLTQSEVSEMLHVSVGTLGNWRRTKTGPKYIKLGVDGRLIRYRRTDVVAWLDSQQKEGYVPGTD